MKKIPNRFVDRTKNRYGRLTVVRLFGIKNHQTIWLCKCDCGILHKAKGMNLAAGDTTSCGCHKTEILKGGLRMSHGQSTVEATTPEYRAWTNMKNRCLNPKCEMFYRYGGRGIKVCDRWLHSFKNFFADMGIKPTRKHSIERKNLNGDYKPSNCNWVTSRIQALNTSKNRFVRFNGERMAISQFCDRFGFCRSAIHSRIKRGWSMGRALKTPNQKSAIVETKKEIALAFPELAMV